MDQLRTVVAHPGAQHSHQLAMALQNHGYLSAYATLLYMDWHHPPFSYFNFLPQRLKTSISADVFSQFRRSAEGINSEKVVAVAPLMEIGLTLLRRSGLRATTYKRWSQVLSVKFQQKLVDMFSGNADALVCYDSNAFEAFRLAKQKSDLILILDQSQAHAAVRNEILAEERRLNPDFADSTYLLNEITPNADRWFEEAEYADWILAASTFTKQSIVSRGVNPSKILLIPYGVNLDHFAPGPKIARPQSNVSILFAGSIDQRKGIKYLLEANKQLALPGTELVLCGGMVGSGDGLAPYRDQIRYIGPKSFPQMPEVFRSSDIFVFPSLVEGFGLVILEAMASGLPVITTSHTGGYDVIEDGVDGFIVPIRDVEAIKEKIEFLYRNPELREEMGRAARRKAEQYSWRHYEQRVIQAFCHIEEQAGRAKA
jgi:starch synthase